MSTKDRREQILGTLRETSYMTVRELAKTVHVSEATIRRDLATLEDEGSLKRSHGGASYVNPDFVNWPFAFRNKAQYEKKQRIATCASYLVQNGSTLFLDSSSSCLCLAHVLNRKQDLKCATCSIPTAQALAKNTSHLVECTGGTYVPAHACFQGHEVIDFFNRRNAALGFISGLGISATAGLTDQSKEEAAIKRAIRSNCQTLVALVDSSKHGAIFYLEDLSLDDIDILVTDTAPPEDLADACYDRNVQLVIA